MRGHLLSLSKDLQSNMKQFKRFGISKKKWILIIGAALLVLIIAVFGKQIVTGFSVLFNVLFNKEIAVQKGEGTVNILLMGIGGAKHEGPNLTDTVMVARIDPETNSVSLVSIPRDLWVPQLSAKINTAYAYGQQRDQRGMLLAQTVVEKVTGLQIQYVFIIDFDGFVQMVDYLGGIDVEVARSFTDQEYPITGKEEDTCGNTEEELEALATASSQLEAFPCRYKTISFQKGIVEMDGETALEYVRSRHGSSGEGNDFARSQRQQAILTAIKSKSLSAGILLNPVKVLGIYNILKSNINTTIPTGEFDDFIKLAQKMQSAQIKSFVLDAGDEEQDRYGLLMNPPISEEYGYQWVLIPRKGNGNFSEIHEYVECVKKVTHVCEVTATSILISPTSSPGKGQSPSR